MLRGRSCLPVRLGNSAYEVSQKCNLPPLTFQYIKVPTVQYLHVVVSVGTACAKIEHAHVQYSEDCGDPAISHDSHHVSLVLWTNLFASRHKGHRFKSPGGTYVKPGILLLALSCYRITFARYFYSQFFYRAPKYIQYKPSAFMYIKII